jgi:hypothetical protein
MERGMRASEGQIKGKFELLFEHYEIALDDPKRWEILADKLAFDHVPGLQFVEEPPRKRGPKKKWTLSRAEKLVREVKAEKARIAEIRRCSVDDVFVTDAIRNLQKKGEQRGLETRYYESVERVEWLKKWRDSPLRDGEWASLTRLGARRVSTK